MQDDNAATGVVLVCDVELRHIAPCYSATASGNALERKYHRMEKRKKITKITKIELAENDKIKLLHKYVDEVLEALGHPEALVTNESLVWDFTSDKNELKRLAKKLKFSVDGNDYIWQLAERCKTRRLDGDSHVADDKKQS